jgi:hypothetical protein
MIELNITVVNNGLVFNLIKVSEEVMCIPPKDRSMYNEETQNCFFVNNINNLEWVLPFHKEKKYIVNRVTPILITFSNNTARDTYIEKFKIAFMEYTEFLKTKVNAQSITKEDKEHIKVGTVIELKGE